MPPKKMSKAEQEALIAQQEEEERLALEAEVKRLEDERLAREEEARQIKLAQIAFRTNEIETLAAEIVAGQAAKLEVEARLAADDAAAAKKREWLKHADCSSLPDASSESDVNTYISVARQELPQNVEEALAECAYTERLATEVRSRIAEADSTGDHEASRQHQALCDMLRSTSDDRIACATHYLVQNADEFLMDDQVLVTKENSGIKYGIWANVHPKSFRGPSKPIAFKDIGVQVDIPKQVNQMKVAVRALKLPFDALSHRSTPSADHDTLAIGGVLSVEIYFLPAPPKQVKTHWLMRQSNENFKTLQRLNFGETQGPGAIMAPIKVHFHVPESVFLLPGDEDRKVVRWDGSSSRWTTDGIQQPIDFHEASRSLKFLTQKTGFFSLAGSRLGNLPYRMWSLAPAIEVKSEDSEIDIEQDEEGCVHLTLSTRALESIKIQIRGSVCQLLDPEIPNLRLKELSPGALLYALGDAGINLIPTDEDAKIAVPFDEDAAPGITLKSKQLENTVHRELASVAASFDFAGSRWNRKVPPLLKRFRKEY